MSKPKLFSFSNRARWSGGGSVVHNNLVELAAQRPDLLTEGEGIPIVLTNRPSLTLLLSGRFVFLPQNSWAWIGKASVDPEWIFKRLILRLSADIGLFRCLGAIRIGTDIPYSSSGHDAHIPNVLDSDFEKVIPKKDRGGIEEINSRTLYCFGACIEYRDFPTVVKALDDCDNFDRLVIRTSVLAKTAFDKLSRLVESDQRVELRNGRLSRAELLAEASEFGMVVFSSTAEASPISVLEIQALGIPYCASAIGAHQQHCSQKRRLFLPGDSKSLASAVNDPENCNPDDTVSITTPAGRETARKIWAEKIISYLDDLNV